MKKGIVYIVGAGPGDTGLFTLRGRQCLEEAEVVVYDFHVNAQILAFARRDAEFIYAGKRGGHHTLTQDQINAVLVEKASAGQVVCRLKGGDPFIFGRGGEEAEALADAGLPFEVVPGISSAIAAPAYAGIPLTHRRFATTVAFIPGHEDREKKESSIPWEQIVGISTLVFLMGVKNLPYIAEQLMKNGRPATTPVAIIRWGTRAEQFTLTSTLGGVAELVRQRNVRPPAVMVVGDVVALREQLGWFEKKPLFGHRILVTRASAVDFRPLRELGAETLTFPTIEQQPPADWSDADRAIDTVGAYDWLVFTSVNAVGAFFERFVARGRDIRELAGCRLAAIGPKTRTALEHYGLRVDAVPKDFHAEGLVATFGELRGRRFLLPRAETAREIFPDAVRTGGGSIDVVTVYRTVRPGRRGRQVLRFLREGRITVATFTSASTFNNFVEMLGEKAVDLLSCVAIATIGPVTREAVEAAGLKVSIMPEAATVAGMVDAIDDWARGPEGAAARERIFGFPKEPASG